MRKLQTTNHKSQKRFRISNFCRWNLFKIWNLAIARSSPFREFGISNRGFTLLEMMVATGIFAVVIVIAVGAMISLNQAQIKAMNIQNIQDNMRFLLESMTKEIRTGSQFVSGNCNLDGCTEITFLNEGVLIGYCLSGDGIRRFRPPAGCVNGSVVTADSVSIKKFLFFVVGEAPPPADRAQPRITILIEAESKNPTMRLETTFHLQTTVTSRQRDIL